MKTTRITLWSVKGGVGKTSIALNIALSLDCGIITNERYTLLDKVLEKDKFLKLSLDQNVPQISCDHSIIFDMGGYLDKRVKQAVQQSDYVIIPTTSDKLDMQGTISTIGEVKTINNNIIIIVNKIEKDSEFEEVKKVINQIEGYPIFPIKKSRMLKNIIDEKKSIQEIKKEGGLKGYIVKALSEQLDTINNFITKK